MSKYLCERERPHKHDFPAVRPDGTTPEIGDIAQCSCGMYVRWWYGVYGPTTRQWACISKRKAKRIMRKYCP